MVGDLSRSQTSRESDERSPRCICQRSHSTQPANKRTRYQLTDGVAKQGATEKRDTMIKGIASDTKAQSMPKWSPTSRNNMGNDEMGATLTT